MVFGGYRGLFTSAKGRLFAVIGGAFYEVNADATYTLYGAINSTGGMVSMAENETQLIIVDGSDGWIFTFATNTFTKITDEGFVNGKHIVNIDGFFVKNCSNSGEFDWSNLRDGTKWDALNFATAEGSPDNLVSIGKINNELWLFGDKSTEIWYDTGDSTSQFKRVNQGFIDIGCAAEWSIATINNSIFWLGANQQGQGIVWMASCPIPQRISTHSEEYSIGKMTDISDAVAFCYQQEGHSFYVLTFPTGNKTLVYDLSTQMWHERASYNTTTGQNDRHRAQCFSFWNGKNYVGDYENGNLYELDLDTFTDNGTQIQRIRTGSHLHNDRKRVFYHEFEADIERGVGNDFGQGADPTATLYWSDDGGFKFSNGYQGKLGRAGKTLTRLHWHRLGMSRDRVFRLVITDPVKAILIGARCDAESEGG